MSGNKTPALPLGALSDIAATQRKEAEERRREAQLNRERNQPEWLLDIFETQVAYGISPKQLPLANVSFPRLQQALADEYSIKFVRDYGLHPAMVADRTDEEIASFLLTTGQQLRFQDGRFLDSESNFVPIRVIAINHDGVTVYVQGLSQVAERVAARVVECIWSSAGVHKHWDDVKKDLQLIRYTTGTKVNLGFPLASLMSDKLIGFIDSQMLKGKKYAAHMGVRSQTHEINAGELVKRCRLFCGGDFWPRPRITRVIGYIK